MANATELAPKLLFSPVLSRTSFANIPKTVFNTMPTAQRLIRNIKIPITEVKQLENLSGSTINDIALCVISGALREYLQRSSALPNESLHAVIPVDIRTDKELGSVGNQLSFINLNIASDISDAKLRLATIHHAA